KARYFPEAPASQLIGYMGENPQLIQQSYAEELQKGSVSLSTRLGVSGLEFTFDRYLRTGEPTTLSYFTDARKRPLQGLDMRLYSPSNPYYPVKVMTTLDLTIQNKVDELLEAKGIENGAIVILNADNADVLA